jgi:hypothetical protein
MTFRNNIGPDAVAAVACLREWRRAAAAQSYRPMAPLAVGVDRQRLPERGRVLRDTGLNDGVIDTGRMPF